MSEEVEKALRARIAALESEVQQMRGGQSEPRTRDRTQPIERLVVDNADQLYLNDRDLALQIIDALPVQIFIKHAEHETDQVGQRGRRYSFMNRKALELTGWEAGEEVEHLDFEAMADPGEYERMDQVETNTIRENTIHFEELRWTAPDGSWRVNDVTQLPIARRATREKGDEVIGFCAIAQDFVFQDKATVVKPLMDIIAHEIGNLASKVQSLISIARTHPETMERRLEEALGWCRAARGIALAMMASYEPSQASQSPVSVAELASKLADLFKALPVAIDFKISPVVRDEAVKSPEAVLGILIELIRNAIKHGDRDVTGRLAAPVEISATAKSLRYSTGLERHSVECCSWELTNKCARPTGALVLKGSFDPLATRRMGGHVLLEIITHAILIRKDGVGVDELKHYFGFDDRSRENGEVSVTFNAPLDQLANGHCK